MAAIKSATGHADTTNVLRACRRLIVCVAAAVCALALVAPAPAQAEDASTAHERARTAALQVRSIQARLEVADAAYVSAISQVGQQVSGYLAADGERVAAEDAAQEATDRSAATARALYRSGGQAGLLNTLLTSGDVSELATRLTSVQLVLLTASAAASEAADRAEVARRLTTSHQAQLDGSVVTAAKIEQRAAEVDVLLREAQETLDGLTARARALDEAQQAARALARARAQAEAAQVSALGAVRASHPPAEFFRLYRAAARTCPGMDWTLLAAVGQVESGHGRNAGVSSAGAVGPMQFMPTTFAAYAVDGDHDGGMDPYAPADAVYTAARYLCVGGAGSPSGVRAALFRYNHAQWYVDLVLTVEAQLKAGL